MLEVVGADAGREQTLVGVPGIDIMIRIIILN